MQTRHAPNDVKLWHQPSNPAATPVDGYDIYLRADLAIGTADLDAGGTTPLEEVRKEFDLE